MKKNLKDKKSLNIAMLGHKRIPSREGGIEIVVEELATRMVTLGHKVTCYNRSGHHVSGKDFDGGKRKAYKGVRLKSVLTLDVLIWEKMRSKLIPFIFFVEGEQTGSKGWSGKMMYISCFIKIYFREIFVTSN